MTPAVSRWLWPLSLAASFQFAAGQSPAAGETGGHADTYEPTPYSSAVWTMAEGMPQNSVNSMLQTRDGYLWLATFGGLARFDGVTFTNFQLTDGLVSNRHVALFEDRHGALWIGHEFEGISRYSDGRFTSYGRSSGLPAHSARAIVEDREGDLWVGTEEGLARLRDGTFTVYTEQDGLPSRTVPALLVDRLGVLWVGTAAGLARYAEGRFTVVDAVAQERVFALLEDPEGALWIDTEGELVRSFEGRFEPALKRSRPAPVGRTLALDHEGRLLALSDSRTELHRWRGSGADAGSEVVSLPEGLTGWTIFVDREGSVWVGTNGEGLWKLRPRPVQRLTARDGLPTDEVRTVLPDGDGGFWISLNCSGPPTLIRWRHGVLTSYPADQNGEPLACVTSLMRDSSGALWLASDGQLIRYWKGTFTRSTVVDDESLHPIYALFEARDGRLWIGSRSGLLRLDGDELTVFTTRDGLAHDVVHFITQSRDGALWIGTNGGLSRFQDGTFVSYTADDGLAPGMVRAVYEDRDGTLWIGTYGGGLSRLRDGELALLTTADGLFDNVISRILEDRRGNLWMLGNSGLSFAARQDLNDVVDGRTTSLFSISFGSAEGMTEGSGGRQPAGWQTDDGKMWFPTIDGLAMVDAEAFRKNDVAPPVWIERVLVNGQTAAPDATIEVPPGGRDLEIHYTGLSFVAPEKMRFEYLLENYDKEWIGVGARRVAYYTNLPPGAFTFRVRAANNHGVWNETGVAVELVIRPFLYERRWFWGLCSLLLILLGYRAFQVQIRGVEQRNRRLQQEIDERRRVEAEREALITKLEAQNTELERFTYTVSHDLKTPLVTIKNFLGVLKHDAASGRTERLVAEVERIGRAADTMAQILDELLELSRVGRVFNSPQEVPITELAREAVELVRGPIAARRVEVVIEDGMPVVRGDRVRLLEIFQNLIDNAVKFIGDETEPRVEVGTRSQDGETVFYVRDNGVGVDPRYQEKIFGLFERLETETAGTGIGLTLVKRIVEVHEGRIWVESNGEGRGSAFCFTLGDLDDRQTDPP